MVHNAEKQAEQNMLMQAVLLASIRQGKRLLQRVGGPDVPPPGAYTTNR